MKNRRALREHIIALLTAANFTALTALAGWESGVATILVQLLYNPQEILHWRALEGLGRVAGAHPAQVQKVIGRLLYLLNEDSGSFGWGAAAALGEIGRHQISLVREIIPMFAGFLEEKFSRGPMLWGLGRLAEVHPDLLPEFGPLIVPFLTNPDPELRALAAWCLGKLDYGEAREDLRSLLEDDTPVQLYDREALHRTSVGQLAREALQRLELKER